MKVSACIITYNHENYIRECLEGAINQIIDYDYEIVISDDKSSDNTLQICLDYASKYPNLIRILPSESNLGMIGNWIKSISNCKGEYIALCEGDDYWTDPLKLQKQVDFLDANEDYVACFTNAKIINEIDNIQSVFVNGLNEGKVNDSVIGISGGALYPTCSLLFRMSNFKAKLFLDIPELAGDDLLILSLAQQGSVFFLNYETCVYRRQPSGVFSSISKIDLELVKVKKKNIVGYSKLVKRREFQKFKKELKRKISLEKLFILKYDNSFNKFQYFFSMHYKELIKYCLGKN